MITPDYATLFPEEYQAWAAAGGLNTNFGDHLKALGKTPATLDDVERIVLTSVQQIFAITKNGQRE